jgi:hypothetical protein
LALFFRKYPLSLRERARVRGNILIPLYCYPLIRPSATFSLREKVSAED